MKNDLVMQSMKLNIKNKTEQLEQVQLFLEQSASSWALKPELVFELNLMLEEYLTNLIDYGYSDSGDHLINLEICNEQSAIKLIITDDAGPFDVTEAPGNEEIDKPLDQRRIGGLGIHFLRKLADHLDYSSEAGINKIIITKKL